jgi:hypothetical protein
MIQVQLISRFVITRYYVDLSGEINSLKFYGHTSLPFVIIFFPFMQTLSGPVPSNAIIERGMLLYHSIYDKSQRK